MGGPSPQGCWELQPDLHGNGFAGFSTGSPSSAWALGCGGREEKLPSSSLRVSPLTFRFLSTELVLNSAARFLHSWSPPSAAPHPAGLSPSQPPSQATIWNPLSPPCASLHSVPSAGMPFLLSQPVPVQMSALPGRPSSAPGPMPVGPKLWRVQGLGW